MNLLHRQNSRRAGFTLVELIIAMTIILIIAALAVAFLPRIGRQERSARGADLLQRWLLISKQRSLTERTPVGLRLIADPGDPNRITELHYIYEPEPYSKGLFIGDDVGGSSFQGAGFDGGGLPRPEWPVQIDDYLELYGGGPPRRITDVAADRLTHAGQAITPLGAGSTSNYKVYRQPRRLQGEAPLLMPQDIAIDVAYSKNIPLRSGGGSQAYEILFSPAGGVMGKGTVSDKIILYVRDFTVDLDGAGQPTFGAPTLITIYTRTGLITAHPVNPDPSVPDPITMQPYPAGSREYLYVHTKNVRSSGL